MHQMTVTLEWDDDLGPRWMNKDNLLMLLQTTESTNLLKIKSCTFPDDTAYERAQEELQELLLKIDALSKMTFWKYPDLPENQREAHLSQHTAMVEYSEILQGRIESWHK